MFVWLKKNDRPLFESLSVSKIAGGAEWDPGGAELPTAESAGCNGDTGMGASWRAGARAGENGEHVRMTRRQDPRSCAKLLSIQKEGEQWRISP